MMRNKKDDIVNPELSYKLTGLCLKVQNKLGRFGTEKQYTDALESLLKENGFIYKREPV